MVIILSLLTLSVTVASADDPFQMAPAPTPDPFRLAPEPPSPAPKPVPRPPPMPAPPTEPLMAAPPAAPPFPQVMSRLGIPMAVATAPQTATSDPNNKYLDVLSGVSMVISSPFEINSFCEAKDTGVRILQNPNHGSITLQQGPLSIPSKFDVGSPRDECVGKSINTTYIIYKSENGYKGSDFFRYRSSITGRELVIIKSVYLSVR